MSKEVTLIKKGKAGVQLGGCASSTESITLDRQLKNAAQTLRSEFDGFVCGHNKRKPIWKDVHVGCEPDGGLWLDASNNVRVAFEAKVQGTFGNAHERHAKNHMLCETFASPTEFRYVTFMAGAGARKGEVLHKYAQTVLRCKNPEGSREINTLHKNGASFFLSEKGWTDKEIVDIMRKGLE